MEKKALVCLLRKTRYVTVLFILMWFVHIQRIDVSAETYSYAMKSQLVYEVTNVSIQNESYVIEGWAFINESQHYLDDSDLSGQLALQSSTGIMMFPLAFTQQDMTYLMKMEGRRRCQDTEYNQLADTCYYDYNYVKFSAVIPFMQLQDNSKYTISLLMHAKKTDKRLAIDVFFVTSDPLLARHNGRTISIKAHIDQTNFYVNHQYVRARVLPSKTSIVYQAIASCSERYGKDQYFEQYSQYFNVKEVKLVNQVSWYKVLTEQKSCSSTGMNYVKEGGINETWIPSSYAEFNGAPATIEVIKENNPPVLYIINQTIYVGDVSFRAENYVSAFDPEEGALPVKKGTGNLNVYRIGTYLQEFSATDSEGLKTSKYMIIRVIAKPANTAPIINAKNKSIYQYSIFNPFDGVTANDLEEGDLTMLLQVLNKIDSAVLGSQNLCYYVADAAGLSTQKCIIVTVISYPKYAASTKLRFVDLNDLFYLESLPVLWQDQFDVLERAATQRYALIEAYLP